MVGPLSSEAADVMCQQLPSTPPLETHALPMVTQRPAQDLFKKQKLEKQKCPSVEVVCKTVRTCVSVKTDLSTDCLLTHNYTKPHNQFQHRWLMPPTWLNTEGLNPQRPNQNHKHTELPCFWIRDLGFWFSCLFVLIHDLFILFKLTESSQWTLVYVDNIHLWSQCEKMSTQTGNAVQCTEPLTHLHEALGSTEHWNETGQCYNSGS